MSITIQHVKTFPMADAALASGTDVAILEDEDFRSLRVHHCYIRVRDETLGNQIAEQTGWRLKLWPRNFPSFYVRGTAAVVIEQLESCELS